MATRRPLVIIAGKVQELPAGDDTGAGGVSNTFIGPTAPVAPPSAYVWFQTGLGSDGQDMTMWIEDGL